MNFMDRYEKWDATVVVTCMHLRSGHFCGKRVRASSKEPFIDDATSKGSGWEQVHVVDFGFEVSGCFGHWHPNRIAFG